MPPVHIPVTLSSLLRQACVRLSYPLLVPPAQTLVSPSSTPSHDYQTNLALSLARTTHQPPPKVAASLQAQLTPELQGVAVMGTTAGFLNFRLEDGWLQAQISAFTTSSPSPPSPLPPTTLLDYASPNVGKELHVGHLRSAVIGDTLARVLEYVGQRPVVRHSHVGDCGLPVALVVNAYLRQQQHLMAPPINPPLPTPSMLSAMYVEEKQRGREGAAAASTTLVALQRELAGLAPRSTLYTAWERVCRASREGYTPLFTALNVAVEERGESCYIGDVEGVVAELVGKGVAVEDEGALIVRLGGGEGGGGGASTTPAAAATATAPTATATAATDTAFTPPPPPSLPPMLIRKADGGYLYATTDLACLRARLRQGLQHIVYITDAAQSLHFAQLFAAARVAGWVDGSTDPPTNTLAPGAPPIHLTHAPFGVVVGESTGKKLSSREGGLDLTSLASLLEAAARYSLEVMEKGGGGGR